MLESLSAAATSVSGPSCSPAAVLCGVEADSKPASEVEQVPFCRRWRRRQRSATHRTQTGQRVPWGWRCRGSTGQGRRGRGAGSSGSWSAHEPSSRNWGGCRNLDGPIVHGVVVAVFVVIGDAVGRRSPRGCAAREGLLSRRGQRSGKRVGKLSRGKEGHVHWTQPCVAGLPQAFCSLPACCCRTVEAVFWNLHPWPQIRTTKGRRDLMGPNWSHAEQESGERHGYEWISQLELKKGQRFPGRGWE